MGPILDTSGSRAPPNNNKNLALLESYLTVEKFGVLDFNITSRQNHFLSVEPISISGKSSDWLQENPTVPNVSMLISNITWNIIWNITYNIIWNIIWNITCNIIGNIIWNITCNIIGNIGSSIASTKETTNETWMQLPWAQTWLARIVPSFYLWMYNYIFPCGTWI